MSDCCNEDHPRVCGEKRDVLLSDGQHPGSPPRVRGKVGIYPTFTHVDGITPACAGKRRKSKISSIERRDHPRVCGEKTKKIP